MGSAVLATRCDTLSGGTPRQGSARARPRISRSVCYPFSTLLADVATIPVRAASSFISVTFKAFLHDIRLEVSDGQ
jgi:hypothetical protein